VSAPSTGAIDATIARISSVSADGYGLRIGRVPDGIEPGPEWLGVEKVLASEGLKAAMLARVAGVSSRPDEYICAEWMIESWSRGLADLAGSFMVCDRRLPDLRAGNLIVAPFKGMVSATALKSASMTALEDDLQAVAAGAGFASDWQRLADRMLEGLTALFAPMIEWADSHGLRPAKTLWSSCGDRVAQSLLWSGKAFDEEDFALELTEYLLAQVGPMSVPVERDLDEAGQPYHLRSTCCLNYRTPEGGYCLACPLIKEIRPPV